MTRRNPSRLEAFTVLELMVALVVSALLLVMAYAALRLVQRQQVVMEQKSAALGQLSTWQEALAADFYHSSAVEVAADQVRCLRPEATVTYTLLDSTLIRDQGAIVDTFRSPIRQCQYFWQGQPRTTGLIDEISLLAVMARDTFYLQAHARYAAQQLVPAFSSIVP